MENLETDLVICMNVIIMKWYQSIGALVKYMGQLGLLIGQQQ